MKINFAIALLVLLCGCTKPSAALPSFSTTSGCRVERNVANASQLQEDGLCHAEIKQKTTCDDVDVFKDFHVIALPERGRCRLDQKTILNWLPVNVGDYVVTKDFLVKWNLGLSSKEFRQSLASLSSKARASFMAEGMIGAKSLSSPTTKTGKHWHFYLELDSCSQFDGTQCIVETVMTKHSGEHQKIDVTIEELIR